MSEKKEFEPLDVGATERVDWKVAQGLNKYVHFDENGNAVIGKNLEVGGTTKLAGGFEPVETLSFETNNGTYTFNIYTQVILSNSDTSKYVNFFGKLDNPDEPLSVLVTGSYYRDEQDNIIDVNAIYFDLGENSIILHIYLDGGHYQFESSNILTTSSNLQSPLYRHRITLNNLYVLMYDSTSSLNVGSVDNLRTIMKISSTSDSVILPVVNTSDLSTAGLQVTTSLCKIGTVNVTAVSDKVTSL